MKRIGMVAAVVVAIAGLIFLGYSFHEESNRDEKAMEQYALMQTELNPLSVRKRELERSLRQIEQEKASRVQAKGTATLLFTDMDEQIYDKIYPVMKKYSFEGVLVISKERYPGAEGCITAEQFEELQLDGWTYCVKWEAGSEFDKWNKNQQKQLAEMELEASNAVFFPKDTYEESYKEQLIAAGFSTIIHCGDAGMPYIPSDVQDPIWFPGAYGMNGQGPRNFLNQAIDDDGSIIYRVGFEKEDEAYEKGAFESMLSWFSSYESSKELEVMNLDDAFKYHKNLTKKREKSETDMSDEEIALREEMKQVEAEIEAVYKKYLTTQEEEEWADEPQESEEW